MQAKFVVEGCRSRFDGFYTMIFGKQGNPGSGRAAARFDRDFSGKRGGEPGLARDGGGRVPA